MVLADATTNGKASSAAIWAALLAVWVVWGSTYFAIRVGVRTIPPMLMASVRFLIAGGVLVALLRLRGSWERPRLVHWRSAAIIGTLLLLGGNGLVTWAEQKVPSGIASLLIATVPLWLAVGDRVAFRQRLSWVAVLGLAIGFAGLGLLVLQGGAGRIDSAGAAALMIASLLWASGSLYSRRARLPSRPLQGAAMEMLCGGVALGLVSLLTGELRGFQPSQVSGESALGLLYLIVFGSWVGFTAYIWLLQHASVSLVGTYAYVNPVVAVFMGAAFLHEVITGRTLLGGMIIVIGVALIVAARAPKPKRRVEPIPEVAPSSARA